MTRSSLRTRAIALAAAAALALTACAPDDDAPPDEDAPDVGDVAADVLRLGQLAPQTGSLAFLGDPQIQAAAYAVSVLNEAGGVLGNEVPAVELRDESDQSSVVVGSANELLREGVNAIIGAAASGRSLDVIDRITGNEIVQCSGSNTAPTFTEYDDGGFYFRTAPSDQLQGPVLANTIVGEGHGSVALTARADDYGRGLMDATAAALEAQGVEVVSQETYDPDATDFAPIVQQITDANPDATAVIAFEEGVQILQGLLEAGVGPDQVYGVDGLRSDGLGESISPGSPEDMQGMKGTAPGAEERADFLEGLREFAPDLDGVQFAPQVFDCVMIIALAVEAAGSATPADFAPEIVGVTRDGENCGTFTECKTLLDDGQDINYQGVSGALNFIDAGEPNEATIEIWELDENGDPQVIGTEDISFDDFE